MQLQVEKFFTNKIAPMKVKHATRHELVKNLSAERRHSYMHKTVVYRYDVTPTCIKLLSVDMT